MEFTRIYHSKSRRAEEEAALKAMEDAIEALAEAKVEGQPDVDEDLADLIDSAPNSLKEGIGKLFAQKVEQVRSDMGLGAQEELTPEQLAALRQLREREEAMIAHMLSRESLRKIRAMYLHKPEVIHSITSLTRQLHEKGMIGITPPSSTTPHTPDTPNLKDKDQSKER